MQVNKAIKLKVTKRRLINISLFMFFVQVGCGSPITEPTTSAPTTATRPSPTTTSTTNTTSDTKTNCEALSSDRCALPECFINAGGKCAEVRGDCTQLSIADCLLPGANKGLAPFGCFFNALGQCANIKASCTDLEAAECSIPNAAQTAPNGCFINNAGQCAAVSATCRAVIIPEDCQVAKAARNAPNGCALSSANICVDKVASCDLIANPATECATPGLTLHEKGCAWNSNANACLERVKSCSDLNPPFFGMFKDLSNQDSMRCETPAILQDGGSCVVTTTMTGQTRCDTN
jgi:hypothetical protein